MTCTASELTIARDGEGGGRAWKGISAGIDTDDIRALKSPGTVYVAFAHPWNEDSSVHTQYL